MADAFEKRKREAQEMVATFLSDYSPPRGISDDALARRVNNIADAFARRMPVNNYSEAIMKVFEKIRDTHERNSWPVQAVFVMAMPAREKGGASPETFSNKLDYAEMMREGLPVPEFCIWGREAARMMNSGAVEFELMEKYREGSIRAHQDTYRSQAYKVMRGRLGAIVDGYFSEAEKQTKAGADQ